MKGWIKVHRNLLEHGIWENEVFSRGQAWIDLLLLVNHQSREVMIGNDFITVERGSMLTSELKLSVRWRWSRKKVRSFLQALEKACMLKKESTSKYTLIHIENYDFYQNDSVSKEQVKDNSETSEKVEKNNDKTSIEHEQNNSETPLEQHRNINGTQTRMYKNIKNDNKVKNDKNVINKKHMQQAAELWLLYPNKKGKEKAMKKLPKLIDQYGYEKIEACIEKYVEETKGKDPQYIKHGSTFFNGAYADYLEESNSNDEYEEYVWEDPITGVQEIRKRKKV